MFGNNESINKLVFSGAEDAMANLAIPEEALKLLMNIKEADKLIEQNTKAQGAKPDETLQMISKMSFNPDTGFTIDPAMLAKLNLAPPAPPKPDQAVFTKLEDNPSISISVTNHYTLDEKTSLVRSFSIGEEGIFLGIIMGASNKAQAIAILSKYSSYNYDENTPEAILQYEDISITVYFDDENIVNQLEFGKEFRGSTSKGLKIGDTVERAIEIYGPPKMKSPKGAIWQNLKVFCTDGYVTSIKIQR